MADGLRMLRDRFERSSAELLPVYGRRRVGRTELLTQFAKSVRSLYFEATNSVAPDQLRALGAVLAAQPLATWEAALAAIAEFVGNRRTLVVLDEFQHLGRQSP